MTIEQLNYFCAAAQFGSFSKAAEHIHISQPSLCIAIRKLEKELNVSLFQNNRRGAVLTDAGRLFLQDTQNVLQQIDLSLTHMQQFSQKDRTQIRFAYTSSLAEAFVPTLLKMFLQEYGSGYCFYSDEMISDHIADGIRNGQLDFGICSEIPADAELEQIPLMYQRLCLLLPPEEKHPDKYNEVQFLQTAPLICYRQDYPMYRLLSGYFKEWNVHPHIVHYAYSESAIARLVEQNLGIGIVAEIEGLERFHVQRIHPEWLTGGRYIYLLRHRTNIVTLAAKEFQEYILNHFTVPGR